MKTTPQLILDTDQRHQNQGSMQHCDRCGRPLGRVARYFIDVTYDGQVIAHADQNDDHPDSLGWFALGAGCAKMYPAGFVFDTFKEEAL